MATTLGSTRFPFGFGIPAFGNPAFGIGVPPFTPNASLPSPVAAPQPNQTFGGFQSMPTRPDMFDVPQQAGKGIGERLKGIVDYFTDKDQGIARQMLLLQGIGTIADLYAANKRGQQEDEDRERRRARHGAVASGYGAILRDLAR